MVVVKTHITGNRDWEAKHDYGVQNTDINAEFKSIGGYNSEQITGEGFMFDPSAVLERVSYSYRHYPYVEIHKPVENNLQRTVKCMDKMRWDCPNLLCKTSFAPRCLFDLLH
jgi:hypothetical protein